MHLFFFRLAVIEIVARVREFVKRIELGTEIRNSVSVMRRYESFSCIMYLITTMAQILQRTMDPEPRVKLVKDRTCNAGSSS